VNANVNVDVNVRNATQRKPQLGHGHCRPEINQISCCVLLLRLRLGLERYSRLLRSRLCSADAALWRRPFPFPFPLPFLFPVHARPGSQTGQISDIGLPPPLKHAPLVHKNTLHAVHFPVFRSCLRRGEQANYWYFPPWLTHPRAGQKAKSPWRQKPLRWRGKK